MSDMTTKTTLIAALLGVAYLTNPDEDSFQRYLQVSMKKLSSSWT
jgi:hypothetical protein